MTTKRIELSADERLVLDDVAAKIAGLHQQRAGMVVLLAHLKGVKAGNVDYDNGGLVVTTQ